MTLKGMKLTGVVLLIIAVGVASGCGGGQEAPAGDQVTVDGETLLEERCTECHGLERTTSQEKTRTEWDETVTRMIDRGAELDEAEKAVLVDYLAQNYGP